jgi:hypothetical protein
VTLRSHEEHEVLATKSTKIKKKTSFVVFVFFVAKDFEAFVAKDGRGVEG